MPDVKQKLDDLIAYIIALQQEHFATFNSYFQGRKIPDTICDGITDAGADLDAKVSDQPLSWRDFGLKTERLPFQIWIDVYKLPSGDWDWCLFAEYTSSEKTWRFSSDIGEWFEWLPLLEGEA